MKHRARIAALFVWLVLLGAACAENGVGADRGAPSDGGEITVFAAASLTQAFTELGERFETEHRGVRVRFSFAGSSSLREQILAGAPADVFASANQSTMQELVDAGVVGAPEVLLTNRLAIAVPAGNPAGVRSLEDFARDALLVGLCAEAVPCGELARTALVGKGVTPAVDTNATDVRALLTQVASGDLDAGIVYRSDVATAGVTVEAVAIPPADNVTTTYLIGTIKAATTPAVAQRFVAFALGREGQRVLAAHGFEPR